MPKPKPKPKKRKVFISYHHENDQEYKEELVKIGKGHSMFVDRSVDTDDIPDKLGDKQILRAVRDKHLEDSTVTIVLVGTETKHRKHVDWEIHLSMSTYEGSTNERSGIVVINLPGIYADGFVAPYGDKERELLYSDIKPWKQRTNRRAEYKQRYPHMPQRIIDNLIKPNVKISVTSWSRIIKNKKALKFLIDAAFRNRSKCKYDLSRPMKQTDS